MSMKNKFGGQVLGDFKVNPVLFELLVSQDGTKFVMHVWAQNRAHAIALLAVAASASYFYTVLSLHEVDPMDWDTVVGSCRPPAV